MFDIVVAAVAQAPEVADENVWFQLLDLFGWPTLFIFGLWRKWWSMGEGVDPTWKEIAMRSIATNEELVQEVSKRGGKK